MTKSSRCRDCLRAPDQTPFVRDGSKKNGFRPLCLDCSRGRRAGAIAVFAGGQIDGEKACAKCGESKPRLDFSEHCLAPDGRNSWCRPCVTAATSAHARWKRATDPAYRESLAAQKRAARRAADPQMAQREVLRATVAALKADHRAHVDARQRHLSDCSAHIRAWREWRAGQPRKSGSSPVYERAKSAWRRARRLGRIAPWCNIADTLPFYERAACLERETGTDWNVDHRIPLRAALASGLHCPANLQVLPRAINEGKSNYFSPEQA